MKAFIVLALVAAVARAGIVHAPAYGIGVGIAETGTSQVSRVENGLGNYAFGYDEAHTSGGSFHKESGAPGVKVGSYGLTGADGRVRVVNYVADALGFRADIKTNEPGVGAQDPAATLINKAGVVAAAPVAATLAAPIANGVVAGGVAAPLLSGIAAPVATGVVAGGVAAPLLSGIAAPVATGVVGGVAAPLLSGIAAPVIGASYSSSVAHGGVVAPTLGLGLAAPAITTGLGYQVGVPGHVTKVAHGAALLGAKII